MKFTMNLGVCMYLCMYVCMYVVYSESRSIGGDLVYLRCVGLCMYPQITPRCCKDTHARTHTHTHTHTHTRNSQLASMCSSVRQLKRYPQVTPRRCERGVLLHGRLEAPDGLVVVLFVQRGKTKLHMYIYVCMFIYLCIMCLVFICISKHPMALS
jgi:hypothetical protein